MAKETSSQKKARQLKEAKARAAKNAAKKSGSPSSSSKKNNSNSKGDKEGKKAIKKYYGEKESDVKKLADTKSTRLKEDLDKILADAGVQKTRAMEDYIRNIGNIAENKAADVADINDYVATGNTRTQENLDTALAKELRRHSIEQDRINQDLASKGMTFSDRTPEKIAAGDSAQTVADINVDAARSFQDIARYEAAKNRDIEIKYGQQEEAAGVTKTRTIEDILNDNADTARKEQRGQQDIAFGKATDIRDIGYSKDTSLYQMDLNTAEQNAKLSNDATNLQVLG